LRSDHPISLPLDTADPMRLRSWLRVPWDCFAMILGLLYWGIFGGLLTLIGGPLHMILPRRSGERLGRLFLHHLFRWFVSFLRLAGLVRADTSALDRLGKSGQPLIAAPNHIALWDAVFIISRLPHGICVMKKSILKNPVLGGGARLAGYIANDGTTRMIRNAAASVSSGGQLLLFPEGTRTKPDARWINPLKGGCAIIAIRAKVPVYPIFIRSNTRFLEKDWPFWKRPVFPIHIRIEVGEPLTPQSGESAQAFTRRLEAVFEQELSKPDPLRRQIDPAPQQLPS
jgi:1-acyl-sn-glycerol-3-phosphate acyltransferase